MTSGSPTENPTRARGPLPAIAVLAVLGLVTWLVLSGLGSLPTDRGSLATGDGAQAAGETAREVQSPGSTEAADALARTPEGRLPLANDASGSATGRHWTGLVVHGGEPVEGARVALLPVPEKGRTHLPVEILCQCSSGADGRFRLSLPDEDLPQVLDLAVDHAGFLPASMQGLEAGPGDRDLGTLELETGGRISGQVVDQDGHPIPGILVLASEGDLSSTGIKDGVYFSKCSSRMHSPRYSGIEREARADEDGRFSIEGLTPGTFYIEVDGSEWFTEESYRLAAGMVGTTIRCVRSLELHCIVQAPDGEPWEGWSRCHFTKTTSQPDDNFILEGRGGDLWLALRPGGWVFRGEDRFSLVGKAKAGELESDVVHATWVHATERKKTLTFRLRPSVLIPVSLVFRYDTGERVPDRVFVYYKSPGEQRSKVFARDGELWKGTLPPGAVRFKAFTSRAPGRLRSEEYVAEVCDGGWASRMPDIVLPRGGDLVIRGWPGGTVSAWTGSSSIRGGQGAADPLELTDLAPGRYTFDDGTKQKKILIERSARKELRW